MLKALAKVPAELNTKLALYWVLFTACRVGEMRFATWGEIEDGKQWAIPAARMKMKLDHLVPLSTQAQRRAEGSRRDPYQRRRQRVAVPRLHRRRALERERVDRPHRTRGVYGRQTAHGFRAAFRTWSHEVAEVHPDIIEACLAHAAQGVRAKYNRSLYW